MADGKIISLKTMYDAIWCRLKDLPPLRRGGTEIGHAKAYGPPTRLLSNPCSALPRSRRGVGVVGCVSVDDYATVNNAKIVIRQEVK